MTKSQRVVMALFLAGCVYAGVSFANSRPNYGEGCTVTGTLSSGAWLCTSSIALRRDCTVRIEFDNDDGGNNTTLIMKRNATQFTLGGSSPTINAGTAATFQVLGRKGDTLNFQVGTSTTDSELHVQTITEGL